MFKKDLSNAFYDLFLSVSPKELKRNKPYQKLLKRMAQDGERAWQAGYADGLAGNPAPTPEGLQELASQSSHPGEMAEIYKFVHQAAVAGWTVGQAERM